MAGETKGSEQVSEREIALYFTNNNEDTADAMLAGEYKDQYALKGVFSSSSLSGAFLIFFCVPIQSQTNVYVAATSVPLSNFDTEASWLSFERDIADLYPSGKLDDAKTGLLSTALSAGMTFNFNQELKKAFESSDPVMVNYRFKRLLEEKLGIQQIRLVLNFEPISSLEIELQSSSASKLNLKELKKRNQEEEKLKETITETRKQDDPLAGKEVKMLFHGRFVLSPIRGKNVSLLTQGDRVRVLITDKNSKSIKLAQAFNSFDEKTQTILPITGRVISNRFFQKSGYEFYVIVAKGIYLKITEDKEDMKVAIDEESQSQNTSQKYATRAQMTPVIIWTCLAALVIIGIIVIVMM